MKQFVFLNGQFVPHNRAVIPINTHALHYGTGCFEGIRGYWSQEKQELFVFRLLDHFRRLKNSCQTLHLKLDHTPEQLVDITVNLLRRNRVRQDAYIRPLVFKSDQNIVAFDLDNLETSLVIHTLPMGHMHNTSDGIKVITSSWLRQDARMIPPGAKPTGIYLNTSLAKTEAHEKGAADAILLNADDSVAEASAANVFLVTPEGLVTPSTDQNILNGITRQTIIQLAKNEFNLKTASRRVEKKELFLANEVFICGTGIEVTPVVQINQKKVGTGKVGETTKKLQQLYFSIATGQNPKYQKWLTVV